MADTALDIDQYQPPPPAELSQDIRPEPASQEPAPQERAFEPEPPPVQMAQATPPAAPSLPVPQRGQPSQPSQPSDEDEQLLADQAERQMYNTGIVSHETGLPLRTPSQVTRADFPNEQEQIAGIREQIPQMPPKAQRDWLRQVDGMEKILNTRIVAKQRQLDRAYEQQVRQQLKATDTPYQSPSERVKQKGILQGAGDTMLGELQDKQNSAVPEKYLSANYIFATSPWNTMHRDRLYEIATNIASVNRFLQPESVMSYVLVMASPADMRPELAESRPSLNGRRGAAGTNYTVVGRDPRDNWLLKTSDGTLLSVSNRDKEEMDRARKAGYAAGKTWLAEDKKQRNKPPGMIERGFEWMFGPPVPKGP